MRYIDYIELGFKRKDMNDDVEFQKTGYGGFVLTKKVSRNIHIEISSPDLTPTMFINKEGCIESHRIKLTGEMVRDIFSKKPKNYGWTTWKYEC